jgi:multiple sugar transport system substrate-binding protein
MPCSTNAPQYIKWFAQADVQKKWWAVGGFSSHKAVLLDPDFPKSTPFASEFLKAMQGGKDFWQNPANAQLMLAMQKRIHDYVVADKGTAKEALDRLIKDWTEIFRKDGLVK